MISEYRQMHSEYNLRTFRQQAKVFLFWGAASLIDGLFLVIWIFVQWLANKVMDELPLSGIDDIVLKAFLGIFAVSTLAPVIIYMYVDIRIMAMRAQKIIAQEKATNVADTSISPQ